MVPAQKRENIMNTILIEKRAELKTLEVEIAEKEREIRNFGLHYEVPDEEYDQMLDDCYGDIDVCGSTYSASYALKNLDPTAYNCGKSDFDSSYDYSATVEYQDLEEQLEELESRRDDLESEIEDLENEEEENE